MGLMPVMPGIKIRVLDEMDMLPVVQASAPHFFVVDRKAQFPYEVKRAVRGDAKPSCISGIRRDLRLDQDDVVVEGGLRHG